MMSERRDVEFCAENGLKLRGWLFVPEKTSRARSAVTMAHGYAGVKEHGLERFARAFAEAGFVVLLHDHRNFGASDGAERGDVDPWQQIVQPIPSGIWENSVTIRSTRAARMYEPGIWVPRVSPTPLLMVVGLSDTVTPTDLALAAYERALEPKKLQSSEYPMSRF
jgi:fermentation-respiration switch protein FrsA (DUF1100 family)